MVEVRLVSSKKLASKRWLNFTYGSDLSVHKYTEPISFARREQKHVKDFLNRMENFLKEAGNCDRLEKQENCEELI